MPPDCRFDVSLGVDFSRTARVRNRRTPETNVSRLRIRVWRKYFPTRLWLYAVDCRVSLTSRFWRRSWVTRETFCLCILTSPASTLSEPTDELTIASRQIHQFTEDTSRRSVVAQVLPKNRPEHVSLNTAWPHFHIFNFKKAKNPDGIVATLPCEVWKSYFFSTLAIFQAIP